MRLRARAAIEGDSTLTQHGSVVGTPSYMAPEQAAAIPGNATIAADVYSLGAILYALFTGRPPFKADTPVETLRQVIDFEPPSPRAINAKVDRDLESICMKALAKEPERRYSSAFALAEDLERWLAGEPIRARRVGRPERIWKWARRRPAVAMMSGLLVTVAIAGLVGMFVLYGKAVTAGAFAVEQAEKALTALKRSETSLYSNRIALAERHRLAHDSARADELLDECPVSLRDWEWRYLKRRLVEDVATYPDHSGPVAALALSPDDRYLVSVDFGPNIHVRDRATGRTLDLRGHLGSNTAIAFSPDGKWMVAGGSPGPLDAGSITLWNTRTWSPFKSLTGVGNVPHALEFSPDSRLLVSGHEDDMVRVWDIAAENTRSLRGHNKAVHDVAFSPDGRSIASASRDTTVRIWDAESGALRASLPHDRPVFSLAFHPQGRLLATSTGDLIDSSHGDLTLWDLHSGQVVQKAPSLPAMAQKVRFSPDGRRLATAGWDRVVRIWDTASLSELLPLTGHTGLLRCIAFSNDGNQVISGGNDGTIRLWNGTPLPVRSGREPLRTMSGHTKAVYVLALTPDGRQLVSAGEDATARVWDLETGRERLTYRKHKYSINALAMRPDGQAVATAGDGDDQTIRVWQLETGALLCLLRGHTRPIASLAFHPDGVRLVSTSQDGTVRLWNTRSGEQLHEFLRLPSWVYAVAFTPDGLRLAAAGEDGGIHLWDTDSRRLLHVLRGHSQRVVALAFHQGSDQLLSASLDGTVRHWETLAGHETRLFDGLRGRGLAWSPDGRHFAMSGARGDLQVWEFLTGRRVLTVRGHAADITSAAYTPDGLRIVTTGWDRTVKVWSAVPEVSNFWAGESHRLVGHGWRASRVALLPDGKRAISGGEDATIYVWDIASGRALRRWVGSDFKIFNLAVTPDGKKVVVVGENTDTRVYEIESGRELGRFNHHQGAIFGLAVTPDGRRQLTSGPVNITFVGWKSGPDLDLHLWNIESGVEVRRFSGHRGGIMSLAISPDGRHAVSGSMDGTAHVWNLDTGIEVRRFEGHLGHVTAVEFLPDSRRVLSGGTDHHLYLWYVAGGAAVRRYEGARGPIDGLAISSDGRHALSSGILDHHLRFWDLDSGRELYHYEVPYVSLARGTFSSDGTQALWASSDGTVRVWDIPRQFSAEPVTSRLP